jgi:hypothetical protein
MKPSDPIRFFGSATAVARLCEVSTAAVSNWGRRGWIPYDKQCLLELEASRVGKKRYPKANRGHVPRRADQKQRIERASASDRA